MNDFEKVSEDLSKLHDRLDGHDKKLDEEVLRTRDELGGFSKDITNLRIEMREYAESRAEKARNTAIGVLGFFALLLSIGGYLGLNQLIGNAMSNTAVSRATENAENSAKSAEALVSGLEAKIGSIEELNSRLSTSIDSFSSERAKIVDSNSRLSAKMADLEQVQSTLFSQISGVRSQITKLGANSRSNDSIVELLEEELASVKSANTENTSKLIQLSRDQNSLRTGISGLESEAVKLNGEIRELRNSVSGQQGRIARELDALDDRFSSLSDSISSLNAVVSRIPPRGVTFAHGSQCPNGWQSFGRLGFLMANEGFNSSIGYRGAAFNDTWTWVHPLLCIR